MVLDTTFRSARADRPVAVTEPLAALRFAGAAFLALGGVFVTVTMLAASMAPAYDFNRAAISDLGVIPETAALFNGALVVIGLLNATGGYLVYRAGAPVWLVPIFGLAGVGAIGAGLVPLDRGGAHSLFALLAFVLVNVEAIAVARVLQGPMRWLAVAAGLTGLIYTGVMIAGDAGNPAVFGAIGHGGSERMIAYPVMLWLIALGGYLLASPGLAVRSRDSARDAAAGH